MPRPRSLSMASCLLLAGCSTDAAPSFSLVGAYFPDWMLCAICGVLAAVGLRVIFVFTTIDAFLRFRLFTYSALGVIVALSIWLIWFGP
ncbi:YtcA family lipoprotein [Acetobacter sp. DsW_063]|uniref:YtcA family lipoprotein n=1 Tax=Acetobacter sp. DsW_063 TaxID=1514894 RepID=UPI000A3C4CCF|nr:YtcA family lipoprotein [Acetobacter sp. DsW_063]OUJ15283.1 hypothetical protein HK28_08650 [Acetobacter sp. DsW_063]